MFLFDPYHYDAVKMSAGEEFNIKIETKFHEDEYLPSDYSLVVWATEEAVDIDALDLVHEHHFPTYNLSNTVQLYDLQGNLIDLNSEDTGSDEGGEVVPDDETPDDETPDDETSDKSEEDCPLCIKVPSFTTVAQESLSVAFQFAAGDNRVESSVEAQSDETSFIQSTQITIDGETYSFDAFYRYDGSNLETKISIEDYDSEITFSGPDLKMETITTSLGGGGKVFMD